MKKIPIVFCTLLAAGLAHADSARTVRATELYADSQSDAQILTTLPNNATLDVLQRRGAWSQVKTSTQSGWVRMMNLRFDATSGATSTNSGNPLAGVNGLLASGRTSNSGTDTTGVRGLTEADLNKAQPNPAEFRKMQNYATNKNTAAAFGRQSKLLASRQPYLSNSGGN